MTISKIAGEGKQKIKYDSDIIWPTWRSLDFR